MARKVGEVFYEVTAQNEVHRGLAAAEGEIDAFKSKIDATDARLEVEADLSELRRDLVTAQRMADALDGEKIQIDVEVRHLEELNRLNKLTDEQKARYKELMDVRDRGNGVAETEQEHLRNTIDLNRVNQKVITQSIRQRKEELTSIKNVERAHADLGQNVDVLGQKYARLYTQIQKAKKLDFARTTDRERIRMNALGAQLDIVGRSLRRAGGDTKDFEVDLDHSDRTLASMARTILETRVHLGFFSTTVKGLAVILPTLGPLILSIAGAAISLVGVLGAGIAGASAVGIAGLTGFGLAALGAGIALKPAITQIGAAFKATKALSDAQLKYGKDSSQAKDKQEQLNNTLKGMTPAAREAFQGLAGMNNQFQKLAGRGIRKDFFNSFAEGIKTAKDLLPTFATGARSAFHAASQGFNEWMRGMRSGEAQQILGDILGNFTKSLPGFMDGLGSIATMLARIGQSASTFLPELSHGFADWAQSLEDSVGKGDQLTSRIGRLVHMMQSVGHFTMAASRALTTMFSIAAGPGEGFLDGATRSLDRWNAEMKRDPEGTRRFFQQSVDIMKELGPAVGRILMTMANLTEAFAPALQIASKFLNVFAQIFAALSNIPAVGPLLNLAAALLILNKALTAFTGLSILSGVAGGAGGGILGRILGGAAGTAGAATATRQLTLFGGEAAGLTALLNPYTAAVLAAGVGTYFLVKAISGGKSNAEQAATAMGQFSAANKALPGVIKRGAAAQQQANQSLAHANKLYKDGKGDTKDFVQSMREVARANQAATDAQQQQHFEVNKQRDAMTDLQDAYNDQKKVTDSWTDSMKQEMPSAFAQVNGKLQEIGARLRLATLNYNRLQQGAAAATPAMLHSLQAIKSVAGRKTALSFRFDDQAVTSNIARLSSRLTRLGRQRQVIKILTDTGSAESKLQRLINLANKTDKPHKAKVTADTSRAEGGIHSVNRGLEDVGNQHPNPKITVNAGGALGVIGSILSGLAQVAGTVVTAVVNVVRKVTGGGATGGVNIPFFAEGGIPNLAGGGSNWNGMIQRANDRALRYSGIDPRAGFKTDRPRYVVGEQSPRYNEYVITENPAFRRSNLRFLRQAAEDLGALPNFAGGAHAAGKKHKKKKGGGVDAGANAVDTTAYDNAHSRLADLQSEYDLDKREYDLYSGQKAGATLGDLIGDLTGQISVYDELQRTILPNLIGKEERKVDQIPKQVKKAANKDFKDKKKKAEAKRVLASYEARQQAQQDFNQDLKDGRGDWNEELHQIPYLIRGLNIDIAELNNAASTGTLLGTSSANQASFNTMKAFASNITGSSAITLPGLGSGGLGSSATSPALAAVGATATGPSARSAVASGGVPVASGGDINLSVSYTEPPKDPHTWASGVAFELGALST